MTTKTRPIDELFVKLVIAAGDRGVATTEVTGQTPASLDAVVKRLVEGGRVFRGAIGRRTMRYFSTHEMASAYESTRKPSDKSMSSSRTRAPWPADAPINYPKDAHGNPLYKYTVVPAPARPPGMPIRTGGYEP